MYSLYDYGQMIADQLRISAYTEALRHTVKPGMVVLDIGTGTGILALLACQCGARHVYAIDSNPAIWLAKEIAAANGYAQSITFIEDLSTNITLPEHADVLVCDLHGVLPLFQTLIPSVADARRRLLASNATLIPHHETLWVALIQAPELYAKSVAPWHENPYNLDLRPALSLLVNTPRKATLTPDQLLAPPQIWLTLDYATVEVPSTSNTLQWMADYTGTAHGFAIWFDSTLADGITLSNGPRPLEVARPIYGSLFFPWCEPVVIQPGDHISLTIHANFVGEDYIWHWQTEIQRGAITKARFAQSTLFSNPLSLKALHKRAENFIPDLGEEGQIDLLILDAMLRRIPLGDIARQLATQFPHRFPTWQAALTRIGDLAVQYSR
jgi:protein arginine N-methyltransferase 1